MRTSPVAEVRMMNEGASPDRVRLIVFWFIDDVIGDTNVYTLL